MTNPLSRLAHHSGIITLYNAQRDVHLLIGLRCIRLAAFGAISLILVQYLKDGVGIKSETLIGFMMTLTIIGDLVLSFVFAVVSDKLGRRKVLILSSFLMLITGAALYWTKNAYVVTLIMTVGIITPSGGEAGPFRSIEQSAVSTLCKYEERSDVFSWYTFSGGLASGLGSFLIGYLVKDGEDFGGVFALYMIISSFMIVLSFMFSEKIEVHHDVSLKAEVAEATVTEESNLLSERDDALVSKQGKSNPIFRFLLPGISEKSLASLLILTTLICIDAFGFSLSSKSWTVYYFKTNYTLDDATLGNIFGFGSFLGAISAIVGTYFCKKHGPIRTMLATHTTSSLLLLLHSLPLPVKPMMFIFIVRAFVRTMDLPSKHVLISTTVQPHERTAAIGFINASKTLINAMGPTASGYLAHKNLQWFQFFLAGILRLSYDFGLFMRFWTKRDENMG